eukprot:GSChrysophyteH1.ASY1.ANO1.1416.1 assembled CDS
MNYKLKLTFYSRRLIHNCLKSSFCVMYPRPILDSVSQQDKDVVEFLTRKITALHSPESSLDEDLVQKQVDDYYRPIFAFLELNRKLKTEESSGARISGESAPSPSPCLLVGINAPQGCGKTTLTEILCETYAKLNIHAVALSLDDFYLTGDQQEAVALQESGNRLLQYRGNAGTHDLPLLHDTLQLLLNHHRDGGTFKLPKYDKSLRNGKGDRAPEDEWEQVTEDNPVQVVLLEGWMLGFNAFPEITAALIREETRNRVNELLKPYARVNLLFHAWLVIELQDMSQIYEWRQLAERKMIATGKAGMSAEQVVDFVSRFMPAYQIFGPTLSARGPRPEKPSPGDVCAAAAEAHPCTALKITIDSKRIPISAKLYD